MNDNNKISKNQNPENLEYILKLFNSKNFPKAKEEIKIQGGSNRVPTFFSLYHGGYRI